MQARSITNSEVNLGHAVAKYFGDVEGYAGQYQVLAVYDGGLYMQVMISAVRTSDGAYWQGWVEMGNETVTQFVGNFLEWFNSAKLPDSCFSK